MKKTVLLFSFSLFLIKGYNQEIHSQKQFQLLTLDPGHFHAALVQKTMYGNIDSTVQVYATQSEDLNLHLKRISDYNNRKENPTHWKEQVYTGADFFEKMIQEKKGNIVVLSGNNEKKSEYIARCLGNGLNVLADKPMAIDAAGFSTIKQSFELADKKKLLLYDIMTERFEINTILQRALSMIPEIFGSLENGTTEDPAVVKESVHYLYKYVSGNVLIRPEWFLDVNKQGEGIADVMTHLVDLVQWESFPEQKINYQKDIKINSAKHWSTDISLSEYKTITRAKAFAEFLTKNIYQDTLLRYNCNGEINYQLKNVHAKTVALWKYKAPEGTGDTYYASMRGTKATLIIKQGKEENYKPALYIKPSNIGSEYEKVLLQSFLKIEQQYPGVALKKTNEYWQVIIPEKYKVSHEEHFAQVVQHFLTYLENKKLPEWEVPNMIAKYYTTTKALAMASKSTAK